MSRQDERGSVLITSIIVSAILGVTLGTYLLIARSEYVGAAYSQSWHKTLTMAEAGIEESLAQINGAGVSTASTAISPFGLHRDFGGGSYDVQVVAEPGGSATIYSTGYVTIPKLTNTISRVIVAKTSLAPLFNASVAAVTNIAMSSRNKGIAFSDSFDSAKANSSGNSHGQVACLNGSVNIGTGSIMGDLLLGPTASVPFTPPSGRIFHNLNADFPEVVTPTPNWLPAAFSYQNIGGTDYTYVFSRANQGEYTINTGGSIYVGADANVCLQIQSANFNASSLYVAGTNQHAGKLLIYALQPNVSLGDVTVESGKAANFVYLGTSKNTSLTIDTDLKFFGTIYAPSAALTYNVPSQGKKLKVGSFSGSCIAKSVQVNGAASFHFDEDLLRHSSMARGYVITSWKEL